MALDFKINPDKTLDRLIVENELANGRLKNPHPKMDALLDRLQAEGLEQIQQTQQQMLEALQSVEFRGALGRSLPIGMGGALIKEFFRQAHAATEQFHAKARDGIYSTRQVANMAGVMGKASFNGLIDLGQQISLHAPRKGEITDPVKGLEKTEALIQVTTHTLLHYFETRKSKLEEQINQARSLGEAMVLFAEGDTDTQRMISDTLVRQTETDTTPGQVKDPFKSVSLAHGLAQVAQQNVGLNSDIIASWIQELQDQSGPRVRTAPGARGR